MGSRVTVLILLVWPLLQACNPSGEAPPGAPSSPTHSSPPTLDTPGPAPEIPVPPLEPVVDVPELPMPDPIAPHLSMAITSPADQSILSGTIAISALSSTDQNVDNSSAFLTVDGVVEATASSPQLFRVNTRALTAGPHVLGIIFRSSRGGLSSQTSSTVRVNVLNSTGIQIPQPVPTPNSNLTKPPVAHSGQTVQIEATPQHNLVIRGTEFSDDIFVSQAGDTVTVIANQEERSFKGPFYGIVIKGAGADDWIEIDPGVRYYSTIYGADGDNVLLNYAARGTIVSIGQGRNILEGNGTNTSYWANPGAQDTVYASNDEVAGNYVHLIGEFYQPWTSDPMNPDYIHRALDGPTIKNPSDAGPTRNLSDYNLFGLGAMMEDVNQGSVGDCYFLAAIQSMANQEPDSLHRLVADLGDGTFVVQFGPDFVRVDANFSSYFARQGLSGDIWPMVMEKAFAYYRRKQNTFASIGWGNPIEAWSLFKMRFKWVGMWNKDSSAVYDEISGALAANEVITIITSQTSNGKGTLVTGHAYSVIGATKTPDGAIDYHVRNPWGIDASGPTSDAMPFDGLVAVDSVEFQKNVIEIERTY